MCEKRERKRQSFVPGTAERRDVASTGETSFARISLSTYVFFFLSPPISNVLQRLIGCMCTCLHVPH